MFPQQGRRCRCHYKWSRIAYCQSALLFSLTANISPSMSPWHSITHLSEPPENSCQSTLWFPQPSISEAVWVPETNTVRRMVPRSQGSLRPPQGAHVSMSHSHSHHPAEPGIGLCTLTRRASQGMKWFPCDTQEPPCLPARLKGSLAALR